MGPAGIVAAFLYTVTPLSYLALSYGNYPTLFAQFLTVIAFALLLFRRTDWTASWVFALFTFILDTQPAGVPRRGSIQYVRALRLRPLAMATGADAAEKRRALLIPISAIVAALIAFLSYYIQYVRVTLDSVRTLGTTTAESRGYTEGGLRGAPWHIATVFANNTGSATCSSCSASRCRCRASTAPCRDGEGRRTWHFSCSGCSSCLSSHWRTPMLICS